jgi:hypothetical protein
LNPTTALYIAALLGPQKKGVNITRNTGVKIIGIYTLRNEERELLLLCGAEVGEMNGGEMQ